MKKLKEKIILFLECFFTWKIKKDKKNEPEEAYVYFCLSFGYAKDHSDLSNQALALVLKKYYLQKRAIIIAQKEIADYLPDVIINFTINKHQKESKYLDTFEVCRQCFNYCQEINLKKILVFAHPDHLWRIKKVMEKLGAKISVADTSACPYNKKSKQIWTKNRAFFMIREVFVRLYYFFSGKI
ncbi:MAG: hypothetical protein WCY43_03570 [Patescibacteria group bacterium]|nr:hypothetical protein [Patescibacteria group bacterium]